MNTTTNFPRMHVSYYVSDLAKTVDFYNSFFGQEANKVKPGYAKYVLDSPALIISFIENPERVLSQFGHLGFQVETVAEVHQKLATAKAAQLPTREEIGVSCCYAVQDKFWVNDPDGYEWEVYYFHQDAEFHDPHYQKKEEGACCMPSNDEKKKVKLGDLKNSCC